MPYTYDLGDAIVLLVAYQSWDPATDDEAKNIAAVDSLAGKLQVVGGLVYPRTNYRELGSILRKIIMELLAQARNFEKLKWALAYGSLLELPIKYTFFLVWSGQGEVCVGVKGVSILDLGIEIKAGKIGAWDWN